MSDRVRAFFALPIPDAARQALLEAQLAMKPRAGAVPRWVDASQMHLTLKFLGWVDPDRVPRFVALTESAAAGVAPVDTAWTGLAAFPGTHRARVIVAEVADPGGALSTLAGRIEAAVEALDIPREERAFRAHVTLARIKRPGNVESWLDGVTLEGALRLDELVLYRSELAPGGSIYTPLARAHLGA